LEQFDEEEIQKFKKDLQKLHAKDDVWNDDDDDTLNPKTLMKQIISILKEGETVTAALRRLGSKENKNDEESKINFDNLTEAAHSLLSSGHYNIYSDNREHIERQLAHEPNETDDIFSEKAYERGTKDEDYPSPVKSQPPPPPEDNSLWEYKVDGKVHGPYTTTDMKAWWSQGYFQGENTVDLRQIKQTEESIFEEGESNEWVRSDTLANHFQ